MTLWKCGVDDCGAGFEDVETALRHQTTEHDDHECRVCGRVTPEGYFAISHAFDEHTRAEYVRAYDADASAVRARERVKEEIEAEANVGIIVERLGLDRDLDPATDERDAS